MPVSHRCLILAIVATSVLGTAMSASVTSDQPMKYPWDVVGAEAACKDKDDNDPCEYSPYGTDGNYLFSYSHEQTLKKDIRIVLKERGFAKQDFHRMLVIKNQFGKNLDTSFLNLPDLFDGGVTPNDFPVKVFLQETWKGMCGEGMTKGWCIGARSSLIDACDGKQKGDMCSYDSLELEKKKVEKVVPDWPFEGECESSSNGKWNWCKLAGPVAQVEACIGKKAGSWCALTGENGALHKGLCMGSHKGHVLYCHGAEATRMDACDGKIRGDECMVGKKSEKPWKGWCGYRDFALQCLNGKEPSNTSPTKPTPAPAPPTEGGDGGSCSSLEKDLKSMRAVVDKIAKAVGPPKPWPPRPTPPVEPPSTRRRSRPKPLPPMPKPTPPGKPSLRRRRRRARKSDKK